jgi:lactate permease
VWSPRVHESSTVRVARPVRPAIAGAAQADAELERRLAADEGRPLSTGAMLRAFAPYMIIIAVLGACSLHAVALQLDKATNLVAWPGLHVLSATGKPPSSEIFKLNWLTAAGNQLFVCGLLTVAALGVAPRRALAIFATTVAQLRWAILTVCSVLALAYVMNLSGQTITLGMWVAGAGAAFAFLSPIVGWFGTAVTGSDTSANSLFGALQVAAAHQSHLSPTLLAAANSSGGVMGKMVSPQNLAIGAAAVGLTGKEGDIFRKVIGWSLLLVLIMAVFVFLQSTSVLSWMVP